MRPALKMKLENPMTVPGCNASTKIIFLLSLCTALGAAQTPPPNLTPHAATDAYYPEHEAAAPFNASLPSIFIVGDSTASYHPDRKVNIVNASRGGRSTRTYMTEGLWTQVLERVKPHDIVLIQLGQNDIFELNDKNARGTIPGIGPEVQEIDNIVTHRHEVVHTYGWYLRNYVQDVRAKGATPIVLSLTTRDVWKEGQVEVGVNNYRESAYRIASSEDHTDFVDASEIIAEQYRMLGPEKVAGLFHAKEPVHINTAGAFLDTRCIVAGLKGLPDAPVTQYLSFLGQEIIPVSPPIPASWSLPTIALPK
jgi:rhamnogalacturonan acetylesterase